MSCLALAGDILPQLTLMTKHAPHRAPTPVRQPLLFVQAPVTPLPRAPCELWHVLPWRPLHSEQRCSRAHASPSPLPARNLYLSTLYFHRTPRPPKRRAAGPAGGEEGWSSGLCRTASASQLIKLHRPTSYPKNLPHTLQQLPKHLPKTP